MGLDSAYGIGSLKQGVCTSSTRPASPFEGQVIFETDTDRLYVYNGTAWVIPNSPAQNPQGLELITTATCSSGGTASGGVITVGSAVASVTVTNAFSSLYQDYRIIYTGGVGNGTFYLNFTLNGASTNYFGSMYGAAYATGTSIGLGINAGSTWTYSGLATTAYTNLDCDIYMPNMARNTLISTKWSFNLTGTGYSSFAGEQASLTQHTGFTITPTSGGFITGGTIRVYGYRNS
jgi:hypothetical protein